MSKSYAVIVAIFIIIASTTTCAQPVSVASTGANSWTSEAQMPTARAYLGVAAVNGKVYAIGGSTDSDTGSCSTGQSYGGNEVSTNEMYDPASNSWVTETPMPTARAAFGIAVYNSLIYCIGGYSMLSGYVAPDTLPPYYDVAANEVYNTVTNSWTAQAPMPSPRYSAAMNIVNGKIYVFAGSSMTSFSTNVSAANINQVFDIQTNTWTTESPPPLPLGTSASAVLDGKIYVLGQNETWLGNYVPMVYNPANDSWTVGLNNVHDQCFTGAATIGVNAPKRIYFFGEQETDIYNPYTDNWTLGTPAPTDRLIPSVAAVNDVFYLIGGRTGIWGELTMAFASSLNEQYTPVGFGTPDPSYLATITPPKITLLSIQNQNYHNSSVLLTFTADKQVDWIKYSLDGSGNVTVTGNTTLVRLPNGLHNITVYAEDTYGNVGASQTITFSIEAPQLFSTATVAIASAVSIIAVASITTFHFLRKRSRPTVREEIS